MSFSPNVIFSSITYQESYMTLWHIFTCSFSWKENYPNSSESTTTMEMSQSVTFPSFSSLFQFQRFSLSEYICYNDIFHFSKYEVIECNIFLKNGKKTVFGTFWNVSLLYNNTTFLYKSILVTYLLSGHSGLECNLLRHLCDGIFPFRSVTSQTVI